MTDAPAAAAADLEPPGSVRCSVLPGALRVITEAMPHVRSATFGVWVDVGSRDESPELAGASHYLEHLLFKGTERRTALQIAAEMDAVGGEMNAFTTKEYTCFYARVLDENLPLAIDVVSDMITSATIAGRDVQSERTVVLEEIAMHDDDPDDVVHDEFADLVFGGHPLGRPVLGTEESISALRAAAVRDYYRSNYETPRLVVAAAGNLEHLAVTDLVGKAFAGARGATPDAEPAATRRGDAQLTAPAGRLRVLDRPTEQANIVLGTIGLSRFDDRRFALGVLNNAFGGGMSSRLFQEIREQRGLAYSVYSYTSQYADTGLFGVYVGCAPARVAEVLDLVRTEMTKVVDSGLSDDEVARGKGQLKGSLVLDLEDSASRMSRIGKSELVYGELLEVDELLARIDAVTADDIRAIAADVFTRQLALGVVGPFADPDQFGALVG